MTVTTRSTESTIIPKLTASLLAIETHLEAVNQEEQSQIADLQYHVQSQTHHLQSQISPLQSQIAHLQSDLQSQTARIQSEATSKRLSLTAQRQKIEAEIEAERAERQRQAEEEQKKKLEEERNSGDNDDDSSAIPLVKMDGPSICTRCREKGLECYRAPRQKVFPIVDSTPGVLKDFVRCKNCIDARHKCRTDVPGASTLSAFTFVPVSVSALVAAQLTRGKSRGSTSSATIVSEPSNGGGRLSAGIKRKRFVPSGSGNEGEEEADEEDDDDEDDDEEAKENYDSDSHAASMKKRRTDNVHHPHSTSTANRSAPGTIKKPNYSTSRSKPASRRIHSPGYSPRVVGHDEEGSSEPGERNSKATTVIQLDGSGLDRLIQALKDNHQAAMDRSDRNHQAMMDQNSRNHQAAMDQNRRYHQAAMERFDQSQEQFAQLTPKGIGGGSETPRLPTPLASSYTRASSSSVWAVNGSVHGGGSQASRSMSGTYGETRREDGERKGKGKGKERMYEVKAEADDEAQVEGIVYSQRRRLNHDEDEEADELDQLVSD